MDERRNSGPQLEDGYIRIANELFDAILKFKFSLKQQSVLFAIVRKTYGYGKKTDDVSASQIGELCGMSRNHVTETLNELSAMGVITKTSGQYGSIIGINKRYETWKKLDAKAPKKRTSPESGLVPNQDYTSPESGLLLVPNQDGSVVPNQDTQKTTFQKTTPKDNPKRQAREAPALPAPPDWMPAQAWQDFIEHRRSMKGGFTALAASKLISRIQELRSEGHCPQRLLDRAVANGWKGVFPSPDTRSAKSATAKTEITNLASAIGGYGRIL